MKKESLAHSKSTKERRPRKKLATATLAATLLLSACSEFLGTTEPTKFGSYKEAIAELDALSKVEGNKQEEKSEQAIAGATPLIRKHTVEEVEKLVKDKAGYYDFTGEDGTPRQLIISSGDLKDGEKYSTVEIANDLPEYGTKYQTLSVYYDKDGKPSVSFDSHPNENDYDSLNISSEGSEIRASHGFDIDGDGEFYNDDDPFYSATFDGNSFGPYRDAGYSIEGILNSVNEVDKLLAEANAVASTAK